MRRATPLASGSEPGPDVPMKWRLALLPVAFLAVAQCAAASEVRVRIGRAAAFDSGSLLYVEQHKETVAGTRVVSAKVLYEDEAGAQFAQKHVDFTADPFLPSFSFENARTGHAEALDRTDLGVMARYRPSGDGEEVAVPVDVPPDAIGDAGFDRFIAAHWESLLAGQAQVRPFLIPSRQAFVRFSIEVSAVEPDTVRFEMKPTSWLLSLVVPPLLVEYDRTARRLLKYEGLSNLRDAEGEPYLVRIRFTYPAKWARLKHTESEGTDDVKG